MAYPASVEKLISPASVVLSVPTRTSKQPSLEDRIIDAAERLIKLTD